MKVLIVLNKNSGRLADSANDITEKKIKSAFNRFAIETEIIGLNSSSISEILKAKLNKSIDAVAAGGGDGTVSSVADALALSEIPLAILPAGTLNHFAKDLKIPFELEKAAEIISKRKTIKVDAGEVNGKIFINNSSIGFYPKIVKKRIENQESGASKWSAMGDAILYVFKKYPLLEVNLKYEKEKINCKTPFVFIGNNKYYTDILSLGIKRKAE